MASGHRHLQHDEARTRRARLALAIGLNIGIAALQIAGGLFANSLGLLSDAAHNSSDVIALVVSYVALRLILLPATPRRTFAYRRAEVLAALFNASALLAVSGWVLYTAVGRLADPPEVLGGWVALFAGAGVLANGVSAFLLHGYHDLNTRAAYLHLLADAAFSLGVLLGGALIALSGWSLIDPLISLLLAAWMIWESIRVVRSSVNILMEATPQGIDYHDLANAIRAHRGIAGVHDLHVWALSSTEFALSAHLEVENGDLPLLHDLTATIKRDLAGDFGITHVTFELEPAGAVCDDPPCEIVGAD